jgi:cytochrome c5
MTNEQRLTAAMALVDPGGTATSHPRAAAFLIRRALEEHLDAYVRRNQPGLERCSMLTKTIWLAQHRDAALAGRLAAVWACLSGACHHHQYTMAPTVGEILSWLQEVEHTLKAIT